VCVLSDLMLHATPRRPSARPPPRAAHAPEPRGCVECMQHTLS
jgi:hypothetical protein